MDGFYDELKTIHKQSFPDWRFGQLMSNFLGWVMGNKKRDIFFPEEDETLKLLKEYVSDINGNCIVAPEINANCIVASEEISIEKLKQLLNSSN